MSEIHITMNDVRCHGGEITTEDTGIAPPNRAENSDCSEIQVDSSSISIEWMFFHLAIEFPVMFDVNVIDSVSIPLLCIGDDENINFSYIPMEKNMKSVIIEESFTEILLPLPIINKCQRILIVTDGIENFNKYIFGIHWKDLLTQNGVYVRVGIDG